MDKFNEAYYIEKVKSGQIDAFRFLIDKNKNIVFNIVLRIIKNKEDAEEIAQDVFIKAFESINKFKGDSKFSTWLYKIAYNSAISKIRKKTIKTTNIEEHELSDFQIDEIYEDFEKTIVDKQEILNKAINKLLPEESTIINLYYLEENSISDICKITSLSISNVKIKLHRARKKLFNSLNEIMIKEIA
ncbi:MAG: RNA polymerase sigma factor [Bacteroidales bacterium]|nr:RNA polymerase sigma factor [Bacteroidales bacterium]MBN2758685.1 RNA polymerase sigma factor [Bacteroidales bacterium]